MPGFESDGGVVSGGNGEEGIRRFLETEIIGK
jgi:hypothetical protein